MVRLLSFTIGNTSESQPSLPISTTIDTGLLTMAIIKPKAFQSVLGQLNQPLNQKC